MTAQAAVVWIMSLLTIILIGHTAVQHESEDPADLVSSDKSSSSLHEWLMYGARRPGARVVRQAAR